MQALIAAAKAHKSTTGDNSSLQYLGDVPNAQQLDVDKALLWKERLELDAAGVIVPSRSGFSELRCQVCTPGNCSVGAISCSTTCLKARPLVEVRKLLACCSLVTCAPSAS